MFAVPIFASVAVPKTVAMSPLLGQHGSEVFAILGLKAHGEGAQTLIKAWMFDDQSHKGKKAI